MSTNCHDCGYRDTEVKSGGATSERGRKITLKVEDTDDLSRDILKVCCHLEFLRRRLLISSCRRAKRLGSPFPRSSSS